MKAIIELLNGRMVNTDNIKCPICGKKMEYDVCRSLLPRDELYVTDKNNPFMRQQVRRREEYTSFFACPNECCGFELKHFIDELIM